MDMETSNQLKCYCLFCRSGQERQLAERLQEKYQDLQVLAPTKLVPEKRAGHWRQREHILLPGYLFVYSANPLPISLTREEQHIYKILNYNEKTYDLQGDDRTYALWIYRHHGKIKPSKIYCIGEEVRVADGPLQDCHGTIKRLDKHKRRVWVSFNFAGEERLVSLGVELLDTSYVQEDEERSHANKSTEETSKNENKN